MTKDLIRFDRIEDSLCNSFHFKVDDNYLQIINISESGALLQTDKKIPSNAHFEIEVMSEKIYSGNMVKVREQNGNISAWEFEKPIPSKLLQAADKVSDIFNLCMESVESSEKLSKEFLKNVFVTKMLLQKLKQKLDQLDQNINTYSSEEQESFQKIITQSLAKNMSKNLEILTKELFIIIKKMSEEDALTAKLFWRSELQDLFTTNSFFSRALQKPLGYAGDYMMMHQIYEDRQNGYSSFDRVMHSWSINEPAARSVRGRRDHFKDIISSYEDYENPTIVSLACGPAAEITEFIKKSNKEKINKFKFILLDQDKDALLFAKKNILTQIAEKGSNANIIKLFPVSVRAILQNSDIYKNVITEYKEADLLYSAGLFDYLEDKIAIPLLKRLGKWVKRIIIGNFHHDNTSSVVADFAVDWPLIYRSEDDMNRMALSAGFEQNKINVYRDQEGIEMFLEIKN